MSMKKKKSNPLAQIAAGFVILAAITGYYLFQADTRKAGPAETPAETRPPRWLKPRAASPVRSPPARLPAFLVHPERKALPDIAFADGEGKPLKLSDWKGASCWSISGPPGAPPAGRKCRTSHSSRRSWAPSSSR